MLDIAAHPAGRLPKFEPQSVEPMDDRLIAEMRAVYLDDDIPPYLDAAATALLSEGREAFADLELAQVGLIAAGSDTHILPWRGTAMVSVLAVALTAAGLDCSSHALGVTVADADPQEVLTLLERLARPVTAEDLSSFVANLQSAKYDDYAPPALLRALWARRHEDLVSSLPQLVAALKTPDRSGAYTLERST